MFKIPEKTARKFSSEFEKHRMIVSSMNIFYNHVKLLNNRHTYIDRKTYKEHIDHLLKDIELTTSPIDAIVPCDKDESPKLFVINQITPEYKKIAEILTVDKIKKILPVLNDARVKLINDQSILSDLLDDVAIYFYIYRYLTQIDLLRIRDFGEMKETIEFVVNNITLKDIKSFLVSRKINEEKYIKHCSDILFNPDLATTQKFYSENHDDIPKIDVVDLIMRLSSNIVLKSDIYIIIGIYLVLSFSITDICNPNAKDSPNISYVRDILSKV